MFRCLILVLVVLLAASFISECVSVCAAKKKHCKYKHTHKHTHNNYKEHWRNNNNKKELIACNEITVQIFSEMFPYVFLLIKRLFSLFVYNCTYMLWVWRLIALPVYLLQHVRNLAKTFNIRLKWLSLCSFRQIEKWQNESNTEKNSFAPLTTIYVHIQHI